LISGKGGTPAGALGLLTMLLPALGVLFVQVAFGASLPDAGWGRFPIRWLPVALLVLPIATHAVALPAAMVLDGRLPWSHWLVPADDGLIHAPADRGWGVLTPTGLVLRIVLNAVVGLVIVSVLAFFEEIGWRAWMLPRLVTRLGEGRGAAASAVIWAAWHVPYALSGIQHIENVPTPALIMLMPLGNIGAGLFLAWLWLRTRSIVMVSLAHGSLNNWGQYAFKFMTSSGHHDVAILAFVNVALFGLGIAILPRLAWRSASRSAQ
jgi:membrane protease YdiL (CAAX protease family)